jgi:hypothetical protein
VAEGQRDKTENKSANDHFERLRKFRSMTAKRRIGTKKTHAKAQRTKISQKITKDTKTDTLKKGSEQGLEARKFTDPETTESH